MKPFLLSMTSACLTHAAEGMNLKNLVSREYLGHKKKVTSRFLSQLPSGEKFFMSSYPQKSSPKTQMLEAELGYIIYKMHYSNFNLWVTRFVSRTESWFPRVPISCPVLKRFSCFLLGAGEWVRSKKMFPGRNYLIFLKEIFSISKIGYRNFRKVATRERENKIACRRNHGTRMSLLISCICCLCF